VSVAAGGESSQSERSLARATALVTGAGSGIGRAIAIALGKRAMSLVLTGRRIAPLEETARAVRSAGGSAEARTCDLTIDHEVEALVRSVGESGGGRLAVLVHSAARFAMSALEETSPDELDALYRSNLRAPFVLTRLALPLLRAAKGDLVFVNSSAALAPGANTGAYAASKAALKALADSLRAEVNRDGVRVLSIFPGRTATPMQAEVFRLEGREYKPEALLQAAEVASLVVSAIALPATAELTDLQIRPAKKL
jgi:NAD(P)-dependent dehydrogenase (short-subunit alcohol dehydrogenase family)